MSWLLVALIPGLLMLAAFGLDRLEAGLTRDRTPVATRPAPPAGAKSPATRPFPNLSDRAESHILVGSWVGGPEEDRLPTRLYRPDGINPEFQAPRHADRV